METTRKVSYSIIYFLMFARRPRGGHWGRKKRLDESFQAQAEEPMGADSHRHFQTVKRMLSPDWAPKMLCIIVPTRRTASPEFFS